jgi:hypothetical protein
MKPAVLLGAAAAILPLTEATCYFQDVGVYKKMWRLSTYKSNNCINKAYETTGTGFGTRCVNFPNNVRSFIFSVGYGYVGSIGERCTIFFKTTNTCSGDTVGRSTGMWKLGELSSRGRKMKSASVQCQKIFVKRDSEEGGEDEGDIFADLGDRSFIIGDDGEWYETLSNGTLVRAPEAPEDFADAELFEDIEAVD